MERLGTKQLYDWLGEGQRRARRLSFVLDVSINSILSWASGRRVPDALHQRMLRLAIGIPEEAWLDQQDHEALTRLTSELERGALAA